MEDKRKEALTKISVQIPAGLHQRVSDWRHDNRVSTLSDAVRELLQRALDAEAQKKGKRK